MTYYYVKSDKGRWSGPWLTAHQAGCVAMAFDGTVHTATEYRAAIDAELDVIASESKS